MFYRTRDEVAPLVIAATTQLSSPMPQFSMTGTMPIVLDPAAGPSKYLGARDGDAIWAQHGLKNPPSSLGLHQQLLVTFDVSAKDLAHHTGVDAVAQLFEGRRVALVTKVERVRKAL